MTDKSRMEMLKSVISEKRSSEETKRGINEEVKGVQMKIEDTIMNDGSMNTAKRLYIKENKLVQQRKDINARIKYLNVAIEQIIMGEGEYDNEQMTIDDIIEKAKAGGVVGEEEDESKVSEISDFKRKASGDE